MDFQKEVAEINQIIEEIKSTVDFPSLKSKNQLLSIEEMEKILAKTQELIDRLNKRASEISEKMGMNRDQLSKMVEDSANFQPDQWEAIQQMQKEIDAFQKSLMQTIFQQQNQQFVDMKREEQKKAKMSGGRRNWIPM